MADKLLNLEGKTPESIFEEVTKKGLEPSAAAILVGSWIYEVLGRRRGSLTTNNLFQPSSQIV